MTISPNLGEMGAPQLGQFSDVAPEGAKIGAVGAAACFGCVGATLVPHLKQKAASSGSWAPHLRQYNVTAPPRYDNSPERQILDNQAAVSWNLSLIRLPFFYTFRAGTL
jgi:hypothetical protein